MNAESQKTKDSKSKKVSETIDYDKGNLIKKISQQKFSNEEPLKEDEKNKFSHLIPIQSKETSSMEIKFDSKLNSDENFECENHIHNLKIPNSDKIQKNEAKNLHLENYNKEDIYKQKDKRMKSKLEIKVKSPNYADCINITNGDEESNFVTENNEIRNNSSKNLLQRLNENQDFSKDKISPKNLQSSSQSPYFASNVSNKASIGISKLSSFQSNSLQNNHCQDLKNENLSSNQTKFKSETNQLLPSSFEPNSKSSIYPIEVQSSNQNVEKFSPEASLKQKNLKAFNSNLNLHPYDTILNNNFDFNQNLNHNHMQAYQNPNDQMPIDFQKNKNYEANINQPLENIFNNNNKNNSIHNLKINQSIENCENSNEIILNNFIRKPMPINRVQNMPVNSQLQIKGLSGNEVYYKKYAPNIPPEILIIREKEEEKKKTHKCNCKKSRCLKLYCECFANGEYCIGCSCQDCANVLQNEKEKLEAFNYVKDKNPVAMKLINKVNKDLKKNNNDNSINIKNGNSNINYPVYIENYINSVFSEKANSLENQEISAEVSNNNSNSNNVDKTVNLPFNTINSKIFDNNTSLISKNLMMNNNENFNNQPYNNSVAEIANSKHNSSSNKSKSPINKNFFEENKLNDTNYLSNQIINLSSSSNNMKQTGNNINGIHNNSIPNFIPNLNLTNKSMSNDSVYTNYNTNINNNLNSNLNHNNNFNQNIINEQIIGCNCTKSNCTKKYCECFKAGKTCIEACRCRDCDNIDCIQRELKNKRKYKHRHNFTGSVYEDFVIEKISIHIEKSNIFIKESVIWDLRDLNKKEINLPNSYNKILNNNNSIINNNSMIIKEGNAIINDIYNQNQEKNQNVNPLSKYKSENVSSDYEFQNKENKLNKFLRNNNNNNNIKKGENDISRNEDNNIDFKIKNNDEYSFKNSQVINSEPTDSFDFSKNKENKKEKKSLLKNIDASQESNNETLNLKIKLSKLENELNSLRSSNKNAMENLNKNNKIDDRERYENNFNKMNLSDISFENKSSSQNENNSRDEHLYEELSSLSDCNNAKIDEWKYSKLNEKPKKINRKLLKRIKHNLHNKNSNKSQKSSPDINKNNEVDKMIMPKNYKNFVSKNTFDTVSSFHNSVRNDYTKEDLRNELMNNSNNNLHLGLMNNVKNDFLNKNVSHEKPTNKKEEILLRKKKSRDQTN